jgi:chromosome partitioning protein
MKTIALANAKGGCGKTTIAMHLAAGLAVRGYKVVLIDADAQANATSGLGLQKEAGFFNLLVRGAKWNDVLRVLPPERYEPPNQPSKGILAVLPGNDETQLVQFKIENVFLIGERLTELESAVDIVVFDTSPTPSLLHGAIYTATDGIIYPTLCEMFSLQGLVATIGNVKRAPNKVVETIGIVPNMFREKTIEHTENLKDLRKDYGDLVWTPVNQRIIWSEANTMRKPVFALAPDSGAAQDAWNIVQRTEEAIERVW